MVLKVLSEEFSVCQVSDWTQVDMNGRFFFAANTDEERSLVCPDESVPENTVHVDGGWKAFRIQGVLDFSLIGILAGISQILAENEIGLFAVSTFNTDYILIKKENLQKAMDALRKKGYEVNYS